MPFAAQRQPLRQRQTAADMFALALNVTRNLHRLGENLLALDMRYDVAHRRDVAVMH